MKNYYEILEVNKKASPETISKVYKYLAKNTTPMQIQIINKKPKKGLKKFPKHMRYYLMRKKEKSIIQN